MQTKYLRIILALFLMVISTTCRHAAAQTSDHDSLMRAFHTASEPIERFRTYSRLTFDQIRKNPDSALLMIDSMRNWADRIHDSAALSRYHLLYGTYFWYGGEYSNALDEYRQAYRISKKPDPDEEYAIALSNLGALFNQMGMIDSARVYLNQALEIAIQKDDKKSLANLYFNLGGLYHRKDYNHLSLEYLLKATDYYEKVHDTTSLIYVYNALANTWQDIDDFEQSRAYNLKSLRLDLLDDQVDMMDDHYNNLGVLYWFSKNDLDSARYYLHLALENLSPQDNRSRFTYLLNLGGVELNDGNPQEAMQYFRSAEKIPLDYEDHYRTSALLINEGLAFIKTGRLDSAVINLNRGLSAAEKSKNLKNQMNAYNGLYRIDSIRHNYRQALQHYKMVAKLEQEMDNESVRSKVAELQAIHETEEKENENKQLRSENRLNEKLIRKQQTLFILTVVILLLIIVFLILLLKNRRKLRDANQQLSRKNLEVLRSHHIIEEKNLDLEKQKKTLQELNLTKDKFFSVVAHDLKSPFNALLGFLELLEEDFSRMNDADKLNIIKTLHESSRNTYSLLINLLDWSRSQRGLIETKPENIHPYALAKEALLFLEQRIRDKQHHVENLIDPQLICRADPNLTQHVLINLINNAVKFTPRGGNIRLSSEIKNDKATITVSDNGIGIPHGKIQSLFSIGEQYCRFGTDDEPGTGLGLIMCKEFVELMGGDILVESTEGRGTAMTFSLPLK